MKKQSHFLELILLGTVVFLLFSISAYADTYNLYFKQKPENGQTQEESSKEPIATHNEPMERTQSKVVVPPSQTGTPQTIVINNNIVPPTQSERPPIAQPTPAPAPAPTPAPIASTEASVTAVAKPSRWRAGAYLMSFVSHGASQLGDPFEPTPLPGYGIGAMLTADLSSYFTLGFFGGALSAQASDNKVFVGMDLAFMPLKVNAGSYDILELGVLVGVSNLQTRNHNATPFHGGLRCALNFNEKIGVFANLRLNSAVGVGEIGLVARL